MKHLKSFYIRLSVDNQALIWERFDGSLINAKIQSLFLASDIKKPAHQTLSIEILKPDVVKTPRGETITKKVVWQDSVN